MRRALILCLVSACGGDPLPPSPPPAPQDPLHGTWRLELPPIEAERLKSLVQAASGSASTPAPADAAAAAAWLAAHPDGATARRVKEAGAAADALRVTIDATTLTVTRPDRSDTVPYKDAGMAEGPGGRPVRMLQLGDDDARRPPVQAVVTGDRLVLTSDDREPLRLVRLAR